MSNRENVEFTPHGATLRGWLFPAEGKAARPGIVMAHGFTAVREMVLDRYAAAFAAAGFTTLPYDHFGFGASDGNRASLQLPAYNLRAIEMPSVGSDANQELIPAELPFGAPADQAGLSSPLPRRTFQFAARLRKSRASAGGALNSLRRRFPASPMHCAMGAGCSPAPA